MYTPFPQPRFDSYESHQPLQATPNLGREFTDLSSIDLGTEENEEELPCRKHGRPGDAAAPSDGRQLLAWISGLSALAACCLLAASLAMAHSAEPLLASMPPLGKLGEGPPRRLTAKELMEGRELTEMVANQIGRAEPSFSATEGYAAVRARVADGLRSSAKRAEGALQAVQLSETQKDGVLHVVHDMSTNRKLHENGLFVARVLQEGEGRKEGVARFVLERLEPRMGEMRRLREEVVPRVFRNSRGVLTLGREKVKFVETLRNRWSLEMEASLPREVSPQTASSRRLAALGMAGNASAFVEEMRRHARDAKNAMATTDSDLTSAVRGLDSSLRGLQGSADQQQLAKSMACDAIVEARNAFATVNGSLASMMERLQLAKRAAEGVARQTVAKRIFKQLKADVAETQAIISADKLEFEKTLVRMQGLVPQVSNNSLILTRSSLMYVQGEVQRVQGKLLLALKEFGALYHVVKGDGKLMDTVRLYASSIFYQLQSAFNVPIPTISNASRILSECLKDPEGMMTDLECRLTYAKMCMELLLGMEVDDLSVEMPGTSPAVAGAAAAALTTAPPLPAALGKVLLPRTVTVTTTTVTTQTNKNVLAGGLTAVKEAGSSLGSSLGSKLGRAFG